MPRRELRGKSKHTSSWCSPDARFGACAPRSRRDSDSTLNIPSTLTSSLLEPKAESELALVVSAKPPAPVPFALLMAGAMSAPQSLPQTLGVAITANE